MDMFLSFPCSSATLSSHNILLLYCALLLHHIFKQHEAIRHALLADPEVALVIQEFLADVGNKAADLAVSSPPRPPRKTTKTKTGGVTTTASDLAGDGVFHDSDSLLINPALETLRLVERATKAMRWKIDSQRVSLQQQQQQQQQQQLQAPSSSSSEKSIGAGSGSESGVIGSSPLHATISYREFHVNCIALFMPLSPKRDIYMAFNSRCPHHYLSEESLQSLIRNHELQQQQRQQRVGGSTTGSASARLDFIIGRVVFIEGQVATSGNAYGLAAGSKYTLLHVEEVNDKEPTQSQLLTTTSPPPSSSRKGVVKQSGMSTNDSSSNNNSDNPSSST